MAHSLLRLKEKICNTPHLMHPASFEIVIQYLNERNNEDFKLDTAVEDNRESNSRYSFNKDIGVAVLNIDGPLSYKPVTMMGFDCGGASYQQIKEDFTYLVDSGAKTIAFSVSSGGGEAFQMMPTANYMRKLASENDVRIITYVDGLSASAAYGLSVIADELIMAPSSEVGSVGVLVRLMNDSKALEKEGYERTFISAGDDKIPFDADGNFRKEFLEDIQGKVDTLYEEFTGFVAEHRNLSVEAVKSTQARTFLPKEAIELGLADRVMTLEEFYTHLADTAQKQEGGMLKTKLFAQFNKTEETLEMTQLAELQEQLQGAQLSVADLTSKFEAASLLLNEKETALAAALSEVAQMREAVASAEAAAVAVKMDARKSKLAAVMSADKVEGVSASLSSLDDSAFETVLSGFTAQKQALEASDMFTELGDQGTEVVPEAKASKSKDVTEDLIKQKLGLK
jgi:ClpP class serine protease